MLKHDHNCLVLASTWLPMTATTTVPIAQLQSHPALIDQVHDRLLAAIVDGTLEPGRRLTQEELALMLGVSRQPVSHALQILKRRGLFVEAGKRGIAVATLDGARIRGLYQVRAALDGLAAELAAVRCGDGAATSAELAHVRDAVADGRKLGTAPMARFIDADVAFHSALHHLSGNAAIAETVAEQWPHFRRSMGLVLATPEMRCRVWVEHSEIFDAVLAGDSAEAGRRARRHTTSAGEETARRLEVQTARVRA